MAIETQSITSSSNCDPPASLSASQILRASTALLRKLQSTKTAENAKASLLDDADDNSQPEDDIPVWLLMTTKKHIVDKKRLKPSKIALPHPYLSPERDALRICLITTDPQRKVKDLIAQPDFPLQLAAKIKRVIGLEKLKAKYKSYESRRQLVSEYDVFLADDRIITYLPQLLGKVFYKSGSKRPIPVTLEGKRQNFDEQGNKRQKLSEGGSKVVKSEARADVVAKEIASALSSALVHLAPSTTTSVKVGTATQSAEQLQSNIETVMGRLVEKFVPQQWKNVRAIHIKGPSTAALPIWLAEELWETDKDILEGPKANESKKRRQGGLLTESSGTDTIEVPGPDGQIRRLEKPSSKRKSLNDDHSVFDTASKKAKRVDAGEKAEVAARKKALSSHKDAARSRTHSKS